MSEESKTKGQGTRTSAIAVERLRTRSLFKPIFIGTAVLLSPVWIPILLFSPFGGTFNGEPMTGAESVIFALWFLPLWITGFAVMLWGGTSVSLWIYSKWSDLKVEYYPKG